MEFRVLGPLEVRQEGRVIELPRQKHRALLARLLLSEGKVVSADRLVEDLWGDRPPASAKASLQNFVSHLRRALGPEMLVTRPSGYELRIDADALDLVRFERLLKEAGQSPVSERAAKLREALGLWRGPPLADVSFEPFAVAEVERLEELATSAREELVDAELALGLHADLVPRIEALVAQNPVRERLRGQLMLALYRCDRQAEALDAYQETRHVLVEELGIEPSLALRELEQAILRQDPALGAALGRAPPVAPEPRMRRKHATVLFAELAVLPAGAGLDAETLHRARSRALQEIRAASEYHGGTIVRAAGDELTALYGVPSAHEDDPLRAVRAALQLRRALDGLAESLDRDHDATIEIRVVVTSGELIVGEEPGQAHPAGRALTLARRLAETAPAGEILLDTQTANLAGPAIETEAIAPQRVRGEADPVAVRRLLRLCATPLPSTPERPIVGRGQELALLRQVFDEARSSRRCRVVSVLGEAGVGKTRLAAEFRRSVADEASLAVGRCVSYGEGATYLPLAEVVLEIAGDDTRRAIAEQLAGDEHAELVAQRVAEVVGLDDAAAQTGEEFWAVRRFLEAVAEERPFVVLFEDVHWAEETFLDLIEYLAQWSVGAPLVIVCLARPELLERRPRWAEGSVALEPLAVEDALELVSRAAPQDLPPEARRRIAAMAEGNPLFAEQLVARAAEEGVAALDAVPPSLEGLLSARLDRLSPGQRAVLERAAVIGREFWHGAVLQLSSALDVPAVGRQLLELVRIGLVHPARSPFPREDAFRFHHVLIRDVAYAAISAELRAELHERVADWLDSQAPGQDELVGHHLEQAHRCRVGRGPADRQARRLAADAGDRLAAAGLRAAKRGDLAAATNLLGRAAALLPAAEATRRDLLAELGVVLWLGGDVVRAEEAFREAIAAAEAARDRRAELRARVELANLRLSRDPEGGADELLSLAEVAIPLLEQVRDDRALGRTWYVLASVHGALHCRYAAGEQAAGQALEHYRRSGWPPSSCYQELAAAFFYGPTPVPAAIRRSRELLEDAARGGEANVLVYLAGLEAMRGRFDAARRLAAEARGGYEELGWTVPIVTNWATVAGAIEQLADDLEEAERVLAASCGVLVEWGEQAHLATQAAELGQVLYRQGRHDGASSWAETSRRHAAADDASAQFSWRSLRAKLLGRDGAYGEAEAMACEAVRLARETDALNQHGEVLLDLAEVLRLSGRPEEAATHVAEALALFRRKGNIVATGKAQRLLSELAVG